jgi:hypothetical protein
VSTSLLAPLRSRDAGTGSARGATAPPPPIFGRSINPILTEGGQIMSTNYYRHPIFFNFRHPWALVKSYNNGARAMWLGIVHLTGMQPYTTYILQTSTPRHSIEKGFAV